MEEKNKQESPAAVQELKDKDKYELTLEKMLKAGLHFGHKDSRWNPKMQSFIFGTRNGVHIIDLEQTKSYFEKALEFVSEIAAKDGVILLVGTKKQAKNLVKSVAERIGMPFVNERWLGGTFTNYNTISKRIKYFLETKEGLEKGKFSQNTKLERLKMKKEIDKLEEKMGGLANMKRLPDAMFILDIKKDQIAVKEAKKSGIKIIALVDSNCDPTEVDYPIPANDDALSALKYTLGVFLKKFMESKQSVKALKSEEKK